MTIFFGRVVVLIWAFATANAQIIEYLSAQGPYRSVFVENRGQVRDVSGRPRSDVAYTLEHQGATVFFRRDGFSVVFEQEAAPIPLFVANAAVPAAVEPTPLYSSRLLHTGDLMHRSPTVWIPSQSRSIFKFSSRKSAGGETLKYSAAISHPRGSIPEATAYRLDFVFERPSDGLSIVAEAPEAPIHFYTPECPEGCENVPAFRRLVYKNVFPHTDLVFYFKEDGGLKYDFHVRPGGSPKDIRLHISPKDGAKLTKDGGFAVETPMGTVVQSPPVAYWTDGANPVAQAVHSAVESKFVYKTKGTLGFAVGDYPNGKTLVIDPYLTFWATYVGTGKYDICTAVAVDALGHSVSAGTTQGRDMPITPGIAVSRKRGGSDLWMAKFDASGRRIWATVHGGTGYEQAVSAALDLDGAVVVGGVSDSKDFYTHAKAYQKKCAGAYDAYIIKLSANGKFEWATFLGGKDVDEGIAVSTDEFRHVYFVGQTVSKDFPVTYGAENTHSAGALDGFVAQLRPDGEPVWISYFGGSADDSPNSVSANETGVYVAGRTHSRDLPTAFGAHQRLYGGGVSDGFLTKFDRTGRHQWTTYIGSKSDDEVFALQADKYITLAGYTQGAELISTPVTPFAGGADAFVQRYDENGALQWGTFFGGAKAEVGFGVSVAGNGHTYLCGRTNGADLPIDPASGYFAHPKKSDDGFIAQFDEKGERVWAGYFGGSSVDEVLTASATEKGYLTIAGRSLSPDLPTTATAVQKSNKGKWDGFVARLKHFSCDELNFGPIIQAPSCGDSRDGAIEIQAYGGAGGYEYHWHHGPETPKISGLAPGRYKITVRDSMGCSRTDALVLEAASTLTAEVQTQNAKCFGQSNGMAYIQVTGGVQPYTIVGSNGQNGEYMTELPAGNYHFTVKDAKGCSFVKSFTIESPPPPFYTLLTTQPTCEQNDGAIRLCSQESFDVIWRDGEISGFRNGLSAGEYPLILADRYGCHTHDTVRLAPPPPPPYTIEAKNATNSAEADGAVVVLSDAQVHWLDGFIGNVRKEVRAGRHLATLWDGVCHHPITIDVGMEDVMTLKFKTTPPTCRGGSDGGVELTVVGGTAPYKYKWSNGAATKDLVGVPAGIYKVEVVDAEGYVARKEVALTEPEKPLVIETSKSPTSCANVDDGKASVRVVSGTPPYRYFWNTGAIVPEISGLAKGKYTISVADGTGCTKTDTIEIKEASPMEVALSAFPVSCQGQADGRVETSVRGGKPPYTFKWSHGALVEDPNKMAVGEYKLTVTDANGCTTVATTRITEPTPLVLSLKTKNAKCFGSETGEIVAEVAGGTAPYTYKWSDGVSKNERLNLKAGDYSVTVTDLQGCTKTATAKIGQNEALKAEAQGTNPICDGAGDGKVDVVVSGGKPPYKFKWSNGAATQNLAKVNCGTYTVEITDSDGCFVTAYSTLTAPEGLKVEAISTGASCTGTGAAEARVVGGKPPFAFVWSNGARTQQSGPLPEGSHTVEVQDANGCKASAKVNIVKAPPLKVSLKALPGLCDENDGGADSDIQGGKPPYRFAWSNGHTDAGLRKVKPGTYTLTVTDADGCKADARVDIPRPTPLKVTYTALHNLCNATADGSIDLKVEGGKPPYSFKWSHGPTTEDVSGLAKGRYSVAVSDANACTVPKEIEIQQAPPLEIKIKSKDVSCHGANNGEIEADVVNAAPPVTYAWGHGANTKDLKDLKAGKYKLTVSDANRCSLVKEVEIKEPQALSLMLGTVNANCGSDGAVNLSVLGGVPPYKIVWSNGMEGKDLKNLPAGIYTATVTDASGCSKTAAGTVESPGAMNATIETTPATCGAANGKLVASVKGGNPPYSYQWNTGAKTQKLENVGPGTYQLTVTDAGGCTASVSQSLAASAELKVTLVGTNPPCAKPEGKVDLAVTGGAPPYKFAWGHGATTEDLSGLAAGKYTVTVTDAAGCKAQAEYNVVYPPALTIKYTAEPPVCGEANGKITLDVSGNNVKIKWADGSDKPKLENLPAGIYTVTVTDGNACTASETIELRGGNALKATLKIKQPRCGVPDGGIEATIDGGQKPYKLSWSHDKKADYSLSGLPAGVYTLTVTDGAGCKAVETVELINTPAVSVTVKGTNPSCGAADGKAEAVVSGGMEPFAFRWNNNAGTAKIEKLDGGEYTVTVTDKMGCTATAGVKLEKPSALGLTAKAKDVSCAEAKDGAVTLTVAGGEAPFTFAWNNGATGDNLTGLDGGKYSVTVTDAKGCKATAEATVNKPAPLKLSLKTTPVVCEGESNGAIEATVSGGTPPYSYKWSNGATGEKLTGARGGSYELTLTDAAGCKASAKAALSTPAKLEASVSVKDETCPGKSDGKIALTVTGGRKPYKFEWNTGAKSQDLDNVPPGGYNVTITDSGGCTVVQRGEVKALPKPKIEADRTSVCEGETVNLDAGAFSGYKWSNGATDRKLTVREAGSYSVTVTDAKGCQYTLDAVSVKFESAPSAPTITRVGGDTLKATGGSRYQWYFNNVEISEATGAMYIADKSGKYKVRAFNTSGCGALSEEYSHVSGTSKAQLPSVRVYPNPNKGEFSLDLDNVKIPVELSIKQPDGKVVWQKKLDGKTQEFSEWVELKTTMTGTFILTLKGGGAESSSNIIVQ